MSKIYDVFADEYIDEKDVDVNAPPERYKEVDDDLLINNAARHIPLKTALILVKALMMEYYNDPELDYTIKRERRTDEQTD